MDTKFWLNLAGVIGSYAILYWTWHAVKYAWQKQQESKKIKRMAARAARELQYEHRLQQKEEDAHYAGVLCDLLNYAESLFKERK